MNDPYAAFSDPVTPRAGLRQAPARPQIRFADDRDALIRTVIGESGAEPPEGQRAVAAVVLNRARNRGMTPQQIVLERNQFEPWGNPDTARRLSGISPNDPAYVRAAAQVDLALAGDDPTGGADHFFAPKAQAALGRDVPSWAKGTPTVIGNHNFYNLGGSTEDVRMTAAAMPAGDTTDWDAFSDPVAPPETADPASGAIEVQEVTPELLAREERMKDPAYQAAIERARGGSENVPEQLRALAQGGTLGFMDEILGGTEYVAQGLENAGRKVAGQDIEISAAMASQAARDSERDGQAKFAAEHPLQNFGLQVAGGLLAPGAGMAGGYVGGATGAARVGRAAQVGAGYGVAFGAGDSTGGLLQRAPDAAVGGLLGAGSGGIIDAGVQRATAGAARAAANPSAARRLSREGVSLTPGQMVQDVPVVGPMLRGAEDAISSIPFLGSAVAGARNEGMETFNQAVLNRALAPIGERLPRNVRSGYEAVEETQRRLGAAYDEVLPRISAQLDTPMYDEFGVILNRAASEMPEPMVRQLATIIQSRVFRGIESSDATINGQTFKRIESELGALAREYRTASDPSARALGTAIEDIRGAVRSLVARQNPAESQRIQAINTGYANLTRAERAAGSSASLANEGTFTPTQLGVAVSQGQGRSQGGRGGGLLQQLASDGKAVLPSTVGDSGTASRGAMTALIGGAATGSVAPGLVAPVVVASLAYSRPAQAALNAIYRRADNPGAAQRALADLGRLAERNPALVPYYEAAARHLGGGLLGAPSGASSPTPDTPPTRQGLLSPTAP